MSIKETNTQSAGNNANQYQAEIINITNVSGITEARAREICEESFAKVKLEFTQEAVELAEVRVAKLEDRLITQMTQIEDAMNAFKDPSFQMLLADAQKTAAASERDVDYDMLSELLVHRINIGEDRHARLGIKKAIEIVDQISDEALLGLTVEFAANQYIPKSGNILKGLEALDKLYSKIIYADLPMGKEWIEHLDLLDLVRRFPSDEFKKYYEFKSQGLSGYMAKGIKKGSEGHIRAKELLARVGLLDETLVDHELNSDYVRIPVSDINDMGQAIVVKFINSMKISVMASEEDVAILKQIAELYEQDNDSNLKEALIEQMRLYPNIAKVANWWDQLPEYFSITASGKVLAHANARRSENKIPDLR